LQDISRVGDFLAARMVELTNGDLIHRIAFYRGATRHTRAYREQVERVVMRERQNRKRVGGLQ
jgi:hypothetical protein